MKVDEIIDRVTLICKDYQVEHLYLFGSYANGTETPTSDIDFFIKDGNDIRQLKEKIEEIPMLKKIDIFEYDSCKNEFFKEDMDYGKEIY